jgi:hypothetical protein
MLNRAMGFKLAKIIFVVLVRTRQYLVDEKIQSIGRVYSMV